MNPIIALRRIIVQGTVKELKTFMKEYSETINIDSYNSSILTAIKFNNFKSLEFLLSFNQYELNDDYKEAIYLSSKKRNWRNFQLLIEDKRLNYNYNNAESLYWAAQDGNLNAIKSLLFNWECITTESVKEALVQAFLRDENKVVEFFISNKKTKKHVNLEELFIASIHMKKDDIFYLLINNCNINPSFENNQAINDAFSLKRYHIVDKLWNNKSVKKTLQKGNAVYDYVTSKDIESKVAVF